MKLVPKNITQDPCGDKYISQLCVVDLAGAERTARTGNRMVSQYRICRTWVTGVAWSHPMCECGQGGWMDGCHSVWVRLWGAVTEDCSEDCE